MPNTLLRMKLSPEEEQFLRHWVYDEAHYREGVGPAKRLQVERALPPHELALLVAAAIPDLRDQERISEGPPPSEPPSWPWNSEPERLNRVRAAQEILMQRATQHRQGSTTV
jgi:hypothetical protein